MESQGPHSEEKVSTQSQHIVDQIEQRYKGLFEHMKAGVAVYHAINDGTDFIFKDFNRAAETISRVKREKVIGKRLLEMFPHMDEFGLLGTLRRVYKTGKAEHLPAAYYIRPGILASS